MIFFSFLPSSLPPPSLPISLSLYHTHTVRAAGRFVARGDAHGHGPRKGKWTYPFRLALPK